MGVLLVDGGQTGWLQEGTNEEKWETSGFLDEGLTLWDPALKVGSWNTRSKNSFDVWWELLKQNNLRLCFIEEMNFCRM